MYTLYIHYAILTLFIAHYRNICNNMRVVVTSASCDAKFQRNFKSYVSLCNRLNTVYCLEWSRMELVDVAIHHLKGHLLSNIHVHIHTHTRTHAHTHNTHTQTHTHSQTSTHILWPYFTTIFNSYITEHSHC